MNQVTNNTQNYNPSIAIITSEFPPEPGGIGNHAYNLAANFAKTGYNVSVVADNRLENHSREDEFDKGLNFNVIRIGYKKNRFLMYLSRIRKSFSVASKSDVIFASGKFSLWVVAFLSIFYKKKTVAVIHGTEVNFKTRRLKKSIDLSLKRFDKIIAVSNYTASLINHLKIKNIDVIPNGFDIAEIKFIDTKSKGKPSIITVGNVTERKGQKNIIAALPTLIKKYPEIHYHIVGTPTEKKALLAFAKETHVSEYITFHGKVSESKKYTLLKGSDIFVMLSNKTASGDVEGFGIALLEANYFGIPAIGAKDSGIEDAINQNKSGVLIKNNDANALLNAINIILDNYNQFSSYSKSWATNFSWDKVIKKYIKSIHS